MIRKKLNVDIFTGYIDDGLQKKFLLFQVLTSDVFTCFNAF